jgi:hypothetical protein
MIRSIAHILCVAEELFVKILSPHQLCSHASPFHAGRTKSINHAQSFKTRKCHTARISRVRKFVFSTCILLTVLAGAQIATTSAHSSATACAVC